MHRIRGKREEKLPYARRNVCVSCVGHDDDDDQQDSSLLTCHLEVSSSLRKDQRERGKDT